MVEKRTYFCRPYLEEIVILITFFITFFLSRFFVRSLEA